MITLASPMSDSCEFDQPTGESDAPAIWALVACQRQLAEVVQVLTDEQYARKPVGHVASSVGGHVRHCLDHVAALVWGVRCGKVDYDTRQRGTDVESNRHAALDAIRLLEDALLELGSLRLRRPLRLVALVSPEGSPIEVATSIGRELAFVLSHTIHHCSLIAVMAKTMAVAIPERFGYAPATLAFLEKRRCVP